MAPTRDSALYARAAQGVQALHPYEPGMPIEELERQLHVKDVIKMASNENPLGAGPKVVAALRDYLQRGDLALYPDGGGFRLKHKLAALWHIEAERITLGNGSSDILEFVARVFLRPGRAALFSQYAFAVYPLATTAQSAPAIVVPALPPDHAEMPYGHDLDGFAARLDASVGAVFLANPNNPTGTWLPPSAIEAFLERVPPDVPVVLDQAYAEFQDPALQVDARPWLDRFPNLVVARTFSKAYGLAGLRVGYGLSSPAMADLMNRIRPPFNVNALALLAAEAALDDHEHVARSVRLNRDERNALRSALEGMKLRVLPSQANFLTIDFGRDSAPIHRRLLEAGIILRPMSSYGMPHFLRATVGTSDQNARLIAALRSILDG